MRKAGLFASIAGLVLCVGWLWVDWVSAREWVDSTGKHRIQAEFVELDGNDVRLKRDKDGKDIVIPLNKLSDADQEYIRSILDKEEKNKKEAAADEVPKADRERADELIEQAMHLFSLDARGNADLVKSKLQEAARLNPKSTRAECIRGLLNVMVAMNPKLAHKNFMACLKRAPNNPAILNNLAVTEVKMRKFSAALNRWEQILKASPESPYITQNLGRLLSIHNDQRLVMPKGSYNKCAELYATALTGDKNPKADDEIGWILLAYVESDPDEVAEQDPRLESHIGSGGTGFVVQEEYIVTNRHVVEDDNATGIKILVPSESELLDAEVVAMSDTADVAVVRCKKLKMKGLPLLGQLPRRGSEIMVLGFPQFDQLGATIKSTRGAVTSLPSSTTNDMMLLDAEINSGNSGGPIANKSGQVVAVTTAVYKPVGGTGGRYGAGIPVISVMPFLRKHIPDLKTVERAESELSWPDVDEKVSESTVLVLVEMTDAPVAEVDNSLIPLNDITCPACSGSKKLKRAKCGKCMGLGVDTSIIRVCGTCKGHKVTRFGNRLIECRSCQGTGLSGR